MIKSPSFENYYGYQNTFTKKNTQKRMMTPKKNIFTFVFCGKFEVITSL